MVTPTEDQDYPELEKLVKEIKQDKRIASYPVGGLSFISVISYLNVTQIFIDMNKSLAELTAILKNWIGYIRSGWDLDIEYELYFFVKAKRRV